MRAHRCFISALIVLCAGLPAAAAVAIPADAKPSAAARAMPDWGTPPCESYHTAEEWPPLPLAEGWARFEGNGQELYAAGSGVLVLQGSNYDDTLECVGLADGKVRWTKRIAGSDGGPIDRKVIHGKFLFIQQNARTDHQALACVDLSTGELLWSRPMTVLLAAGDAGVWATKFNLAYWDKHPARVQQGDDLLLLDSAAGQELREFKLGPLFGFATQIPTSGAMMPVVTSAQLNLCHSDGSVDHKLRARPGWQSSLYLDDQGLLDVTCPRSPSTASRAAVDRSMARYPNDDRKTSEIYYGSRYYKTLSHAEARLYSLPRLVQAWQAQWADDSIRENAGSGIDMRRDQIALCGGDQVRVLQRSTGSVRTLFHFLGAGSDSLAYPLADAVAVEGEWSSLNSAHSYPPGFIKLSDGQRTDGPPGMIGWPPALYADGYLCYESIGEGNSQVADELPASNAIVCVKADRNLQIQPGQLTLLDPPPQFGALVAKFYASPDPLIDTDLMAQVVAAGQRGLHRLLAVADGKPPRYLDALIRADTYELGGGDDNDPAPVQRSLGDVCMYHLERLGVAIEGQVLGWIHDPQLTAYRQDFETVLIRAGGPLAAEYAAQRFPVPNPTPFPVPLAPQGRRQRDSDGDGLPDAVERTLLLDPHKADTDGDGLADGIDPTPNVNPVTMGKIERGIARALDYYFSHLGRRTSSTDPPSIVTDYFVIHGAGPVAFALPGHRGISVVSDTQKRQAGVRGRWLNVPGEINVTVGEEWGWRDRPHAAGKVAPWGVTIGIGLSSTFVEMKEVGGEYYPVAVGSTWIADRA